MTVADLRGLLAKKCVKSIKLFRAKQNGSGRRRFMDSRQIGASKRRFLDAVASITGMSHAKRFCRFTVEEEHPRNPSRSGPYLEQNFVAAVRLAFAASGSSRLVCGQGMALTEIAPGKCERLTAADMLRMSLDDLAVLWRLATRRPGDGNR
jgi:hypothetical protein